MQKYSQLISSKLVHKPLISLKIELKTQFGQFSMWKVVCLRIEWCEQGVSMTNRCDWKLITDKTAYLMDVGWRRDGWMVDGVWVYPRLHEEVVHCWGSVVGGPTTVLAISRNVTHDGRFKDSSHVHLFTQLYFVTFKDHNLPEKKLMTFQKIK